MNRHLLVDLSAHGFGHVAQTAPVVNALRQRFPTLRLTLRGDFPQGLLSTRFDGKFDLIRRANDVGMPMASAIDVLTEESATAYRLLHERWAQKVDEERTALERLHPDLILANVPYLSLAAAGCAGIPAIAMSSLNWAAIYKHYCGHLPGADDTHGEILDAYRSAHRFLRVEPGLPMEDLDNRMSVGPIAMLGRNRRQEIDRLCRTLPEERLILFALGGIAMRLPIDDWPVIPGVRWLVPGDWEPQRSDAIPFERLNMSFLDILTSSDAVITKPGYGTFVEAACNGVPILTVKRDDWPEEPYFKKWLTTHAVSVEVDRERLWSGNLAGPLDELLLGPHRPQVSPSGVGQVAEILASYLYR